LFFVQLVVFGGLILVRFFRFQLFRFVLQAVAKVILRGRSDGDGLLLLLLIVLATPFPLLV
jgi:hypothetical protein